MLMKYQENHFLPLAVHGGLFFSLSLQDTEIINTAILTGRTVAIPVKMVSIEMNGAVTDISAFVQCKSTNEDIVKVQ